MVDTRRWLWPTSGSDFLQHENYRTLTYAPLIVRRSEILVEGSDEERDGAQKKAKRRKIEKLGQSYLQGQPLFIASAALKGPFSKSGETRSRNNGTESQAYASWSIHQWAVHEDMEDLCGDVKGPSPSPLAQRSKAAAISVLPRVTVRSRGIQERSRRIRENTAEARNEGLSIRESSRPPKATTHVGSSDAAFERLINKASKRRRLGHEPPGLAAGSSDFFSDREKRDTRTPEAYSDGEADVQFIAGEGMPSPSREPEQPQINSSPPPIPEPTPKTTRRRRAGSPHQIDETVVEDHHAVSSAKKPRSPPRSTHVFGLSSPTETPARGGAEKDLDRDSQGANGVSGVVRTLMPAAGLLPDGTSHDASRSIFITTKPAPTADPSPGDKEKQDTHTESTSFGSTAPQRVFRLTTGFTPINRISSSDPSHVRGEAPVNHATATDVHDPSKNASVPVPVEARKYKGRPRNLPPPSSFVPASSAPDVGSATRPLSPQPRKSYQTAAVNTLSPFLYRRTSAPMKRKKDSPSGKLVKPESKRKRKTLDPSAPQAPLVTPSALTLLQVPTTVATPAPAIDMSFNDGSLEMNFELINKYTNSIIPASAHGENRRKSVASEIRRVMRLSGASFMGTPGDSGSPEGSPMRSPANSGPVADTLVVTSKGHGPMHGGADETYATARKDTNVLGNFPELSTQAAMQEAQRALWDDFVSPEKAFDPPVKAAHKTPARISEPPGDAVTPFAAFNAQLLIQPTTASPAPMVSTQALFDAYTPIVSTTKKQQPKKRASFAPSPLAAHRSNSDTGAMQPDYEPGAVGRKTGLTLKDTGIRDEHGLEPISGIFSSFSPKGAFAKADEHAAIVEKTAVEKIPLSSGSTRPASPQRNDVSHVPIGTPVADVSDNDQEAVSSQLQQEMEQSFSHSTHKTSDQGVQRQPPAMMSSTNPASTPESYILRQEPAWSFSALDGTAEDPTADKPTIPVTAAGQSSPHRNSTLRVGVLPHQDRATPNPLNPPSSANGAPDHPTLLSWPASTHPATSTTPRSLRRRDSETPVPPSSSGFSHLELSNYQAAQRYDSSAAYPNLTGQNIHVTDAMDVMDVMDAVLDGTVEELRRDVLGSQTWDVGREIGSAVSSSF